MAQPTACALQISCLLVAVVYAGAELGWCEGHFLEINGAYLLFKLRGFIKRNATFRLLYIRQSLTPLSSPLPN